MEADSQATIHGHVKVSPSVIPASEARRVASATRRGENPSEKQRKIPDKAGMTKKEYESRENPCPLHGLVEERRNPERLSSWICSFHIC